jgi:predicted sulfurtransferase
VVDFRRFGFLVNAHSQWINMDNLYFSGRHFVWPGRYIVPFSSSNYTIMLCDNCTT